MKKIENFSLLARLVGGIGSTGPLGCFQEQQLGYFSLFGSVLTHLGSGSCTVYIPYSLKNILVKFENFSELVVQDIF